MTKYMQSRKGESGRSYGNQKRGKRTNDQQIEQMAKEKHKLQKDIEASLYRSKPTERHTLSTERAEVKNKKENKRSQHNTN